MKLHDLKGQTILMAVSGGLDSCTITHWLAKHDVDVVCYTADLGQPDEDDIEDVRQRMLACGAREMIVGDLRQDMAQAGLQLIQAGARYEGGYWNTTGIGRHVVVAGMVPEMQSRGIHILGHGATGRGNDQVRFELASEMLDPRVQTYAPWRDDTFLESFRGRREMIAYCEAHSLPVKATLQKPYSTDANVLGLTHEAGELEALTTPTSRIQPGMGVFPQNAPDVGQSVEIRFEHGQAVAIDGVAEDAFELVTRANELAGAHGVGIGLHAVENRFVGIKSRGIYEAPGLELLGQTYEYLTQLTLDRRARRVFEQMSTIVAEQIYQGYWFDTATQACWAAIDRFSQLATGTIRVHLFKGNVQFEAATDAPHSLYSEDRASMEDVGEFDHRDSQGFLGVLGVSARALNTAGQIPPR
ncbi:MAG: argininosuccinate synthase [Gemmatimonadetes bacterium]|jgi:argininosuccinate synthase|nr:argininosuccinate synthase [Gemmatimonadota bacterium]MBT5146721.1 argininosuccinate synthase [Gemmatimonadota bacterium]MBT5588593.1 argininosuccinate synthase [Gemmatimonadota bacterium]MBT5962573.1 argininosuccinate synthase [Gemmatimonadota bacterium]MBT7454010.1 argininosuccinate synthase [Gemmatimonadota bacterium]